MFIAFDPVAVGSKSKCPLLLIAGDADTFVPMSDIDKLRMTLESENTVMGDCEIIIIEGAGHGFAHHPKSDDDKTDSESLFSSAAKWLTKYLKE